MIISNGRTMGMISRSRRSFPERNINSWTYVYNSPPETALTLDARFACVINQGTAVQSIWTYFQGNCITYVDVASNPGFPTLHRQTSAHDCMSPSLYEAV
jgi:hypothetical protein